MQTLLHRVRLELEALEDRQLLDAGLSAPPLLDTPNGLAGQTQADFAGSQFSAAEQLVAQFTNQFRRSNRRPRLRLNTTLSVAALRHAENLARLDSMGDSGNPHFLFGMGVSERVSAVGYRWRRVGENIALGTFPTNPPQVLAQTLVNNWIASPGHRANLIGGYRDIGVGIAISASGQVWAVQVFGTVGR